MEVTMISFDEMKEKAKTLAQTCTDRAVDAGRIAKLNINNFSDEESLKKLYSEIGRLYYLEHGLSPEAGFETLCDKVTEIKAHIEETKAIITKIKINGVIDDEVCDPDDVVV